MTRPEIELPDDVEALKAMVLAMAEKAARVEALEKQVDDLDARNADVDERIERLTQILKAFDRARFGRRSEKLAAASVDDEQHAFVFEEIENRKCGDQRQGYEWHQQRWQTSTEATRGLCGASGAYRSGDRAGRLAGACGQDENLDRRGHIRPVRFLDTKDAGLFQKYPFIQQEIDDILQSALEEARKTLADHRDVVLSLAEALRQRQCLRA